MCLGSIIGTLNTDDERPYDHDVEVEAADEHDSQEPLPSDATGDFFAEENRGPQLMRQYTESVCCIW